MDSTATAPVADESQSRGKRWLLGAVASFFVARLIRRGYWADRAEEPAQPQPQPMSLESEDKWVAHLVESFQRDVFFSYLGGFASYRGQELPEAMAAVVESGKQGPRMSFARDRARRLLDDRIRDLERDWQLRPEARERLEREVQASSQILLTCHTTIKSWQ